MSTERFRSSTKRHRSSDISTSKSLNGLESLSLIWLDGNANKETDDTYKIISHFQKTITNIKSFDDGDQCVEFLQESNHDKVCMIISGSYGERIVQRVHSMNQINSIFIFCRNKKYHEEWVKSWPKIRGVFTEVQSLANALTKLCQQYEHDPIPWTCVNTTEDISRQNFDKIDQSFVRMHVLKKILLQLPFDQKQSLQDYVKYYRNMFAENDEEIRFINYFEKNYGQMPCTYWYTCNRFLSSMINRAFRMMDMDLILKLGFFIADLHHSITQQLNKHIPYYPKRFYYGQGVYKSDWNRIREAKNGLFSFESFMLASENKKVQMNYAKNASSNNDMIGILFVIVVDFIRSTSPYFLIPNDNQSQSKYYEILFTLHSVFRIKNIVQNGEDSDIYRVELTFLSDHDTDLHVLSKRIHRRYNFNHQEWYQLAEFLQKIENYEKAQEIYEKLLKQCTNKKETISIYYKLGLLKDQTGKYDEAIEFYEKALSKQMQLHDQNHPYLARTYSYIGDSYYNMKEYDKALSYYSNAFHIRRKSLSFNDPSTMATLNDIGHTHFNMGKYTDAILPYEKVLEWRRRSSRCDYYDLIVAYNNLALTRYKQNEYTKALKLYEEVCSIQNDLTSRNHADLALTYSNIGLIYNAIGEYEKALSYYKRARVSQEKCLSVDNVDEIARICSNIGVLLGRINKPEEALDFLEQALTTRQNILAPNHLDLAVNYNNIGIIHEQMENYSEAYSSYEKAVKIAEQSLAADHANLTMYKNNLNRFNNE